MIGNRRLSHERDYDVLRLARGVRLGNTEKADYETAVGDTERALGLR